MLMSQLMNRPSKNIISTKIRFSIGNLSHSYFKQAFHTNQSIHHFSLSRQNYKSSSFSTTAISSNSYELPNNIPIPTIKCIQENDKLYFVFSPANSSITTMTTCVKDENTVMSKKRFILSPCFYNICRTDKIDGHGKNLKKIIPIHDTSTNITDTSNVDTLVDKFVSCIESHYKLEDGDTNTMNSFVGGMGENDQGVWFVSDEYNEFDTLDYSDLIKDIIDKVKERRHGIPFGIYTSGIKMDGDDNTSNIADELKSNIGLSMVEVSLGSGNPQSYMKIFTDANISQDDTINMRKKKTNPQLFGEVCNFILMATENGFPISVGLVNGKDHVSSGQALAKSLGAVDVLVYDYFEMK